MSSPFDIAIAGGGPAGAVAAIEARRRGLNVVLWDRDCFPRDKVCGEFISGESVPLLEELIPLEAARGILIRKSAFISPSGKARVFALSKPALGLSRRLLDDSLWRTASSRGAESCERVSLQKVRRVGSGDRDHSAWEIESDDGTVVRSRWLVLACGRWWAIDGLASPAHLRRAGGSPWVGLKAHFSGIPGTGAIEMFYFPGGYCGLAPVEDNASNVCCLVHRELVKGVAGNGGVRNFRCWLRQAVRHEALDSRLRGAAQASETLAAAPLDLARRSPSPEGAILIGDASGFIDPFTGDGISIALQSGRLAAELVAGAESNSSFPSLSQQDPGREYARQLRRAVGRSYGVAGLLRKMVSAPAPIQELLAVVLPRLGPALMEETRWRMPLEGA